MTEATDAMRIANVKHGHALKGAQSKEYIAYRAMLARCLNPKNKEYHRYGQRGIAVCERWRGDDGFVHFLADMGLAPTPAHSLDRYPDNDGGYEPGNCRWATSAQQHRNRHLTIIYEGRTLAEWAAAIGVNYHTFMDRWRSGDRGDDLLRPSRPSSRGKDACLRGHSLSGANVSVRANGSRRCLACDALRQRNKAVERRNP